MALTPNEYREMAERVGLISGSMREIFEAYLENARPGLVPIGPADGRVPPAPPAGEPHDVPAAGQALPAGFDFHSYICVWRRGPQNAVYRLSATRSRARLSPN